MMNSNHGFSNAAITLVFCSVPKIVSYFLVVKKYILAFPRKLIFCIYVSTSYYIFNYFVTLEIIKYIIG